MALKGGLGNFFSEALSASLSEAAKIVSKMAANEGNVQVAQAAKTIESKEIKPNLLGRGFGALFDKKKKKKRGRPRKLGKGLKALIPMKRKRVRKNYDLNGLRKKRPGYENSFGDRFRGKEDATGQPGQHTVKFNTRIINEELKLLAMYFYRLVARTPVDEDYEYTESRELSPSRKKSFVYRAAKNGMSSVKPLTKNGIYVKQHKKDENVAREKWSITIKCPGNIKTFLMSDFPDIDFEHVGSDSWRDVWEVFYDAFYEYFHDADEETPCIVEADIYNGSEYLDVLEYGQYTKKDVSNDSEAHKGAKYYHGTNGGYSVQAPRGIVRLTDHEFETARYNAAVDMNDEGYHMESDYVITLGNLGEKTYKPSDLNFSAKSSLGKLLRTNRIFDERDILKDILDGKPTASANASAMRKIRNDADKEMIASMRKELMEQEQKKQKKRQAVMKAAQQLYNAARRTKRKKEHNEREQELKNLRLKIQTNKQSIYRKLVEIYKESKGNENSSVVKFPEAVYSVYNLNGGIWILLRVKPRNKVIEYAEIDDLEGNLIKRRLQRHNARRRVRQKLERGHAQGKVGSQYERVKRASQTYKGEFFDKDGHLVVDSLISVLDGYDFHPIKELFEDDIDREDSPLNLDSLKNINPKFSEHKNKEIYNAQLQALLDLISVKPESSRMFRNLFMLKVIKGKGK